MKRTVIILTGVATLSLAIYLGSPSRAQEQGQVQQVANSAPAAVSTKIALINIMGVVRNYQKWVDFEKNYKNGVDSFDKQFEDKKKEALRLKTEFEKTPEGEARERIKEQMKGLDREVQDLSERAKRELSKYREAQAVQIYQEIQEAAAAYARGKDIGIVLHYADATAQAEYYHPLNVLRKLQTQACLPLYVDPRLDITKDVTDMLNSRLAGPANPGQPRGNQ